MACKTNHGQLANAVDIRIIVANPGSKDKKTNAVNVGRVEK